MSEKEEKLTNSLKVISKEYKKIMHEEDENKILRECSLKECAIIESLSKTKKTMSELAKDLNLSPASITAYIDKLIEDKIVKRENDTEDRRKIYINLTNKGKELSEIFDQKHQKISKKLLSYLEPEEKSIYIKLNEKIANNLTKNNQE